MTEQTEASKVERWDCHEHRDELLSSNAATVYHLERGQLCSWEVYWDCIIYHPVQFTDRHAAQKWIESGCIADIQESFSMLQVGFSNKTLERRNHVHNY